MFYMGGIGLAAFLTLLLFSKQKKTQADWFLGFWLLLVTLHLLFFYLWKTGIYNWLGADMPLPLVHGPMLYMYAKALTGRSVSFKAILLHLLMPIGVLIYLIPFYLLPVEQKFYVFQHNGEGYEAFNLFRINANVVSGVLYIVLASLALRRHRQTIVQEFSTTDKINLQWLQYLTYWLAAIWVFVIIGDDYWVFGCSVMFVLFIGFFGIRQVGIFHSLEEPEIITTKQPIAASLIEVEKPKYSKSGLSDDAAEKLHRDLIHLIKSEKVYLNSELTLADLAIALSTQPNYLSQVINEREKKNFYDFINTLRIEEFKHKAGQPGSEKFTLMGLAQECGFNSKSSFNRYFKKATGQSPSEFLDLVSQRAKPAA